MTQRFIACLRHYKFEFVIFLLIFLLMVHFICLLHCLKNKPSDVPIRITVLPLLVPLSDQSAPSTISESACIDIEGIVSGNIIPGSKVSLYETPSTNYWVVMNRIRTSQPVDWTTVNETSGFKFSCLSQGNYAFVIPSSSYNGVIGAPLPYEFACENISLDIAFQGGDSQYMVGAFAIENSTLSNATQCLTDPLFCRSERGSLYRKCPLDP